MTTENPPPNDTLSGPAYDIAVAPNELEQAIWAREGTSLSAEEIRFRCPLSDHEDVHPSARYKTTKRVWYCDVCGVGGDANDLAERLGLDSPGCTLIQYSALKQLPIDALRGWGLAQISYQSAPAVRIPYFDVTGSEVTTQFRVACHRTPKLKFKSGSKPHLYGLWRRDQTVEAGYVVMVEGPSDCHTLWFHEEPAIGLPGAANYNPARDDHWFDDIPTIFIVIEPDTGGEAVERWLATSRIRDRARLIDLSPFGVKDPSALHCLDPERFQEPWAQAKVDAVPWADRERAKHEQLAAEAEREAGDLLDAPDVLALVGDAMADAGYAGDLQPPTLAYLALTSRLTDRPLNLAFVARASAGKNRAVDTAAALMPGDAYYLINAASERVLVFNTEDFQHRVVIFNEADSIPNDGPAATAIRNLAADNAMRYEVTEQDASTGRWGTRLIEKPGPTGLITTSTRSLGDQLGTRVLETTIPDSEDQTRLIMEKQALEAMGIARPTVDVAKFIAYQQWLALRGERRVVVPFALTLATLIPAKGLRMRRDFAKLLSAVKTVAILHQRHRDRMPDGEIVADLQDYAAALALLAPVFDAIIAQGLTPAIQQTVEAIGDDEIEVTIGTLVERLGLEKPSVWYRVRKACAGGWLVNTETRKGQPAKLRRGDPLPERSTTLPLLEDVEAEEATHISVSTETGKGSPPPPSRSMSVDREEASDHDEERSRPLDEDDMAHEGGGGTASLELVDTLIRDRLHHANGHGPHGPLPDIDHVHGNVCAECRTPFPADGPGFYCARHGGRRANDGNAPGNEHEPLEGQALAPQRNESAPSPEEGAPDHSVPSLTVGTTGPSSSRVPSADSKISLITDTDELRAALAAMRTASVVGIDCETTGLDPRSDRLRLVTIAAAERILVFDVDAVSNWASALGLLLTNADITKVFHHAKFDVSFLVQAGLEVINLFDTMLASQVLDGGLHLRTQVDDPAGRPGCGGKSAKVGYHSLAALAHRELGYALDKTHQTADWSEVLTPDLVAYAAADAAVLVPLHRVLAAQLTREGLTEVAALEFAAVPAVVWMESSGTPFDVASWTTLRDAAAEALQAVDAELTDVLPGVNVDSPTQVLRAFTALGIPLTNAQETTLRAVATQHPAVDLLLRRKEAKKRVSTYGDTYLRHVNLTTGRVHAHYQLIGAASGRMACSSPNLQNIPREPAYRQCIRPPAGHVLVKADYSQIELRIAAQVSGDAAMQAAFRAGEDLHTTTAQAVLGRAPTNDDRQLAKALNFGLLYGMGASRLRSYAEHDYGVLLSEDEAAYFRQRFFATYPGIRQWHRRQPEGVIETRTLTGRVRRGVERFPEKLASPISGTGADILKRAMGRLWEHRGAVPSAVPVLVVHDEIVVEVDAEDATVCADWLVEHMTAAGAGVLSDVPVAVEVSIITDWSGTPWRSPERERHANGE